MHFPHGPMPFRKSLAEPVADQNQTQDQRYGAGNDMRIECPLVRACEVRLPPAQKIIVEIRRQIIAISKHHAERDFENQHDCQKQQDALQIR